MSAPQEMQALLEEHKPLIYITVATALIGYMIIGLLGRKKVRVLPTSTNCPAERALSTIVRLREKRGEPMHSLVAFSL